MKRTNKLTPEVHAKAEGFIANGYQRLVTFEVPGGGFSWFGQAPANQILTAYGLMEFHDMAQVHDVDERLIARTQQWLASRQQPDGSWKPDTQFINEGATNRFNTDVLRITAYAAWALEKSGYQGPAAGKARTYVESHLDGIGRCLHAGGGGEPGRGFPAPASQKRACRGPQFGRPRVHAARHRPAGGRAQRGERPGVVDGGRNGRLRPGRERGGGDHRPGSAGVAESRDGIGHCRKGATVYRVQERCHGRVGNHAGHHHGAAARCSRARKRAEPTSTARWRSRSTASRPANWPSPRPTTTCSISSS